MKIRNFIFLALFPLLAQGYPQSQFAPQCALDLCGDPKENTTMYLNDFNIDKFVPPGTMDEWVPIEAKIRAFIEEDFDEFDAFMETLGEKLARGELDREIGLEEIKYYDYLGTEFFSELVEFKIDRSKPLKDRVSYQIEVPPNESLEFQLALEAYAESKKEQIMTSFHVGLEYGLYTFAEAQAILPVFWQRVEAIYQKNRYRFSPKRKERIATLRSTIKNRSFHGLEEIHKFVGKIRTGFYWKDDGYPHYPTKVESCNKTCQEYINRMFNAFDLNAYYLELQQEANKDRKEFIDTQLAYCRNTYATRNSKDHNTEGMDELIETSKNDFLEGVSAILTSGVREAFKERLATIQFGTKIILSEPSDRSNRVVTRRRKTIRLRTDSKKEIVENLLFHRLGLTNLFYRRYCPDFFIYEYNYYIGNPERYYDHHQEVVLEFSRFHPLIKRNIDNRDYLNYEVNLSKVALENHHIAREILAHELSHALSEYFSLGQLSEDSLASFRELRSCSNGFHLQGKSESKHSVQHPNDKFSTEEDTADLLHYFTYPHSDILLACFTLAPSLDGKSYHPEDLSLEYPTEWGHSPKIVRLVREAIYKRGERELPLSCQKFVDEVQDRFIFHQCSL